MIPTRAYDLKAGLRSCQQAEEEEEVGEEKGEGDRQGEGQTLPWNE